MILEPAVYWKLRTKIVEARITFDQGQTLIANATKATQEALKAAGVDLPDGVRVNFNDDTTEVLVDAYDNRPD